MLPLLRKSADARIVNVASMSGHLSQLQTHELRDKFTSKDLTMLELQELVNKFENDVQNGIHRQEGWGNSNYGMSKLAVIAATKIWAREEPGIKVNCCCPGYCKTDMSSHRGTRDPSDGAKNAVIPATMEDPPTGEFFRDYKVGEW
jgi:carbonyl reductase 1